MESGVRQLTESDLNILTTTKQTQFGAIGLTEDGRRYRYVSFGGTSTIAPGLVVCAAVPTAAYQALAITASGTGGQVAANYAGNQSSQGVIVLTNGATAVTQDQFAEGFLEIIVGGAAADAGSYSYRIKGNSAAAASTGYITVFLAEAFRHTTALVPGTDTANLLLSPYSTVAATATAGLPVGATIMPVPNTASVTNYGWVQVGGACNLLNDAGGTITVGGGFGQSVATAGNIVAATASTHPIIGYTRLAISASNAGQCWLSLT